MVVVVMPTEENESLSKFKLTNVLLRIALTRLWTLIIVKDANVLQMIVGLL